MTFRLYRSFLLDLLLLNYFFNFSKLDELVYGLEGNSSLVINLLIIKHLVHIVRGDRAYDILILLIVPDLSIFVQFSMINLVKQSKNSRLIIFLSLRARRNIFFVLRLSYKYEYWTAFSLRVFLLNFLFGLNVKIIGVV